MGAFLSYNDVGQKLGVSASLIKKLAREGVFQKIHVGRRVVFCPADIEKYMSRLVGKGKAYQTEAK